MKGPPQQPTPPSRPMFPIIGIGSSAGSLGALELLLRHVSASYGIAFVGIQHLLTTHVGNLPELLQRSTTTNVSPVDRTTKVQPDHIYVLSTNKDMSISKQTLRLSPRELLQKVRNLLDDNNSK